MSHPSKPGFRASPIIEEDGRPHERRASNPELSLNESERDLLLRLFKEQNDNLNTKIDRLGTNIESLKHDTANQIDGNTRRILALESDRLEEVKTRVAVTELNASVRELLSSDRLQNQDIGALKHQIAEALRPQLKLDAELDGAAAGKHAGKQVSKFWSGLGVAASIVVVASMQYCQQQVQNYRNGTPPTSSTK